MLEEFLCRADGSGPPLRVGVLLDDWITLRVFAEVLEGIARCDFADLTLVVTRDQPALPTPGLPARILRLLRDPARRRNVGFHAVERVARRGIEPERDPTSRVDVRELLRDIPHLAVRPRVEGYSQFFPDDAVAALRDARLDVLLRFGFGIIRGDVLTVARCGVWSYHHGDNEFYRGAAPGIWELIEDAPASGAMLQVLSSELDAGLVLAKGVYPTARGLSPARNRLRPYWGTSGFVLRKLREVHRDGWDAVRARAVPEVPYRGRRKMYRAPTVPEIARWLVTATTTWATRRLAGHTPIDQEWELAVRPSQSHDLGDGASYHPVPSAPGRFYADPCAVEHQGDTYVFFEDWDWSTRRGHISCGRIGLDGTLADVRPVVVRPYHLSFPFVFRHADTWYMIPETAEAGAVHLLRAEQFPDVWTEVTVLLNAPALDTVAHEHDGRWYFFTTLLEPRSDAHAHCLFVADGLAAPWRLHPASPLSTTLRGYRSAGAMIRREGSLLRPVQSAERGYGTGLEWMRVEALTPTDFREVPIAALTPPPGRAGGHTYTATSTFEIIDLCWNRSRRMPPNAGARSAPVSHGSRAR